MQASKKIKGSLDRLLKNEMGMPSQTPTNLELAEAHQYWNDALHKKRARKGPEFCHWQNKSACAAL